MAGIHHRIIRKGQKLLPDGTDQVRSTAVDKIRPSHRILEQGIPAEQHMFRRHVIAAAAPGMPRRMEYLEIIAGQRKDLSVSYAPVPRKMYNPPYK